ncbi:hypothetical protein K438DRAFT_1751331 [Mycena galopus ATCC 62051]|nr:hypothetical protein K438DRAFT_1751331 [Mycena galopus ATCC 62051]
MRDQAYLVMVRSCSGYAVGQDFCLYRPEKRTRGTAVTAVFRRAVSTETRAVTVPWTTQENCQRNGHGTRATGAVEPWPRSRAAALDVGSIGYDPVPGWEGKVSDTVFIARFFHSGDVYVTDVKDGDNVVSTKVDKSWGFGRKLVNKQKEFEVEPRSEYIPKEWDWGSPTESQSHQECSSPIRVGGLHGTRVKELPQETVGYFRVVGVGKRDTEDWDGQRQKHGRSFMLGNRSEIANYRAHTLRCFAGMNTKPRQIRCAKDNLVSCCMPREKSLVSLQCTILSAVMPAASVNVYGQAKLESKRVAD